ncbi:hypothetical protein Nit79A3_1665 [Nitrosomonas sp. Is79A3]
MKRKTTPSAFDRLRHRFPPIPLYRSDLEEIIRIANVRELTVRLSDDKHEFESIDDLKENQGDRIRKLSIIISPENSFLLSVDVEINDDGITLITSRDDKLLPIWHEIKEIIEKRLPWYARFMRPIIWIYTSAFVLWLTPKPEQLTEDLEWLTRLGHAVGTLSFLLSMISLIYLQTSKGIYLQRQHEVKGIWDRYGEKVILLILGTVLGVFGKVISDKLLGQ